MTLAIFRITNLLTKKGILIITKTNLAASVAHVMFVTSNIATARHICRL